MHEPSDRPPTLSPSNNTLRGRGSQISGELSFGEGHRPFYHLLKTPFGAISHVAQLDAAHPFWRTVIGPLCCHETGRRGFRHVTTYEMCSSNSVKQPLCILKVTPCPPTEIIHDLSQTQCLHLPPKLCPCKV